VLAVLLGAVRRRRPNGKEKKGREKEARFFRLWIGIDGSESTHCDGVGHSLPPGFCFPPRGRPTPDRQAAPVFGRPNRTRSLRACSRPSPSIVLSCWVIVRIAAPEVVSGRSRTNLRRLRPTAVLPSAIGQALKGPFRAQLARARTPESAGPRGHAGWGVLNPSKSQDWLETSKLRPQVNRRHPRTTPLRREGTIGLFFEYVDFWSRGG
jgi:hypothetical protein